MRSRSFIEAFEPNGHDAIIAGVTLNTPLSEAQRAELPSRVRVTRPPTETRAFVYALSIGPWVLPPIAYDVLRDLEPDAHDFHEIEAVADGVSLGRYFLMLEAPVVDCVDLDATIFKVGRGGREYYEELMSRPVGADGFSKPSCSIRAAHHIALKASAIAGRHWWRTPRHFRSVDFCSLALKQAFKNAGVAGLQYTPCEATKR